MAKRGMDDAMFCEACGARRDQLGLAGDDIRTCPECERATCSNCWNQVASVCLTCRAFALPIAVATTTAAPAPSVAPVVAAGIASKAVASTSRKRISPRGYKRAATPQPDPVVVSMPGVAEPPAQATLAAVSSRAARFGTIRIGRVIRATAIGSVLAISIGTVGFAGVLRLGPSAAPAGGGDGPAGRPPSTISIDRETTTTTVADSPAPIEVASTSGPDDRGTPTGGSGPATGPNPAGGEPDGTIAPTGTADPTPTAGSIETATPTSGATPTADPTAEPTAAPTPDPTDTPVPDPTDTPVPDPTDTPVPDPTDTPVPDPTP